MVWRYEFYFLALKIIIYSLAGLVRKISFLPLENKIHIFAPPCNILYAISNKMSLY